MVYISGAVTGTTDYMERFAKAEQTLRELDLVPINPTRVNAQMPIETTYQQYMKMSIAMLDMCDTIFMLKGWYNSVGAAFEHYYAEINGKSILYEKE